MNPSKFKLENIIILILVILVLTKVQLLGYINLEYGLQSLIVLSFFVFLILGIIGILLKKHWGYFSTYIFILSSVLLGIAPIPLITKLFPIKTATFLVFITSLILFLFTLFLHLRAFKNITKDTK
jgi:hypothetical protein